MEFSLNITFSIDDLVAEQAGVVAEAMGKSLDEVILDYLVNLAESTRAAEHTDMIHPEHPPK
jgi:hypothetical protein